MDKNNAINPHHYAGSTSLECIDCMKVAFGNEAVYQFCLCNAFKYMWRYKNKNGEEDLKKAEWYLNYVQHGIECDVAEISEDTKKMYIRLRDLYVTIPIVEVR